MDTEPYWQRIARLRSERGLSQDRFFAECVKTGGDIGYEMLRRYQRDPAKYGGLPKKYGGESGSTGTARYPTADALEIIAKAFGISPEEFPEYRLARARWRLDDRAVGLEQALRNLGDDTPVDPSAPTGE